MLVVFNTVKIRFPSVSLCLGWDKNAFCSKDISIRSRLRILQCPWRLGGTCKHWWLDGHSRVENLTKVCGLILMLEKKVKDDLPFSICIFFWRAEDDHVWCFVLPFHLITRGTKRYKLNCSWFTYVYVVWINYFPVQQHWVSRKNEGQ